jgi:hypothetical protein
MAPKVATILILVAGLTAVANGVWFILGDHPFDGAGGYSDELGMTKTEVDRFNTQISDWVLHVTDQVGAVSLGWGLFLMALAAPAIRQDQRWARRALWLGGAPTLIIAALGEFVQFGTLDVGTIISMTVLVLFLLGMFVGRRGR